MRPEDQITEFIDSGSGGSASNRASKEMREILPPTATSADAKKKLPRSPSHHSQNGTNDSAIYANNNYNSANYAAARTSVSSNLTNSIMPTPAQLMSQSMTLPSPGRRSNRHQRYNNANHNHRRVKQTALIRENIPTPLDLTGTNNGKFTNGGVMSVSVCGASPKLNNRENEVNSHRHVNGVLGDLCGKSVASPKFFQPFNMMSEMLVEPVEEEEDGRSTWEYHSVTLHRVPGFGFGIAVSGGRDNPHFKSGDPSIVVSDVVRSGPAWGQLQVNDRILSANGVPLENAEYQAAVQIMKENEQLNMIIKRRVPLPTLEFEQRTLKFTLTKSRKKDDFGIVLGCKYFIKDITNPKLADKEPGLKEGDSVLRINGQSLDGLTLSEASKLLERSREKLSLVIQRDVPRGTSWKWSSQNTLYERVGSMSEATPRESPRASPMLYPRSPASYGAIGDDQLPGAALPPHHLHHGSRLNNVPRSPGHRTIGGRMTASDYVNTVTVSTPPATNGGGPIGSSSPKANRFSFGQQQQQSVPPSPGGAQQMGSRPPSRSRTPNQGQQDSSVDIYKGYAPTARSIPPTTPPPPPSGQFSSIDTTADTSGSGLPPRPPPSAGSPDVRLVSFRKESGSVGIRVVGGNEVGIFVSAVQSQSPAATKGVRPGDKILRVNGRDMRGVTREEAVLYLLGLQEDVELLLQYRKEEYDRARSQQLGDNFYIRTHFDHDKPSMSQELTFKRGDIFQIIDTLFGGTVGHWQAIKVYSPADAAKPDTMQAQVKGVIPNAASAEKLAMLDPFRVNRSNDYDVIKGANSNTLTRAGGAFLRKKMGLGSRRSKSLTKGHWDEVAFGSSANVQFPAYERVRLKSPGFLRPVALFGPLADVARELLLKDFPLRFAAPLPEPQQSDNKAESSPAKTATTPNSEEPGAATGTQGIVRLSSICEIMSRGKHCVLDVTPSSVEKLQYAQYAPIVIFIDVDSKGRLKELRTKSGAPVSGPLNISTRKMLDQGARIKKYYSYLLTATLDATKEDHWFEGLKELIGHLQDRRVWMAESQPTDVPMDDFLFPMANSRFTNYDSDGESMKGDYSSDYGATTSAVAGATTALRDSKLMDSPRRMDGQMNQHNNINMVDRSNPSSAWTGQQGMAYATYYDEHNNRYGNYGNGGRRQGEVIPIRPGDVGERPRLGSAGKRAEFYAAAERDAALVSHFVTLPRHGGSLKDHLHQQQHQQQQQQQQHQHSLKRTAKPQIQPKPPPHCSTFKSAPCDPPAPAPPTPRKPGGQQQLDEALAAVAREERELLQSTASEFDDNPVSEPIGTAARCGDNPSSSASNHCKSESGAAPPSKLASKGSDRLQPYNSKNSGLYDIKQILADQDSSGDHTFTTNITSSANTSRDTTHELMQQTSTPPVYRAAVVNSVDSGGSDRHSSNSARGGQPFGSTSPGPGYTSDSGRPFAPPSYQSTRCATDRPGSVPAANNPDTNVVVNLRRQPQPPQPPVTNEQQQRQQAMPLRVGAKPPPPVVTNSNGPASNGDKLSAGGCTSDDGTYRVSRLSSQEEQTPTPPPVYQATLTSSSPSTSARDSSSPQRTSSNGTKPPVPQKPNGLNNGHHHSGGDQSPTSNGKLRSATNGANNKTNNNELASTDITSGPHTVVAHVSGVFDSCGGVLSSDETDVSIHVPPGAIKSGIQQEIYFKVCRDTQMAPPLDADKGETLLSPLVMCGPQGLLFDKPVELRLPHSASGVNTDQWSFALKSASGAGSDWKQVSLTENGEESQAGRLDEKYVSVQIDHF